MKNKQAAFIQTVPRVWLMVLCFLLLILGTCRQPTDNPKGGPIDGPPNGSVDRFQANSYTGNDKIKYSYTYDGYDFYYIYLGELKNIPIFYQTARYHSGLDWTYTFSTTNITQSSIREVVTRSSQTVTGIVDEHTKSTTNGGKVGLEINAKFNVKFLAELGAKVNGEYNWSKYISDTTTNSFQQTTSLTNTVEHATSYTWSTMESDEFHLDRDDKVGYYRYTLFSASDVYLYVIRDTKTNEIYYEFREHVIPEVYFWRLDYSETPSFSKSDATVFELDISLLENLPKPALDFSLANPIPDTPTGLEWLGGGRERPPSIRLTWSSVSRATGYYIYRSLDTSGPYTRVGSSATNSYKDTELSISTNDYYYYYKVSAYNDTGESPLSSYVSALVAAEGLNPFTP